MRVVLYNLQYGGGSASAISYIMPTTRKKRLQNLASIIEALQALRPDVLGMIEADAGSWRMAGIDMAQELAKALDLPYMDEDCKYPSPVNRVPLISYNIAAKHARTFSPDTPRQARREGYNKCAYCLKDSRR